MEKQRTKELSEEFELAFFDDGRMVAKCQCGRTHFATYGNDNCFDPGELERLRKNHEQCPDMFHEHDCSAVGLGSMQGKDYIQDCPCTYEELPKYEEFLWNNRSWISTFINARLKINVAIATTDQVCNTIKEA